jgi:hypothetical protein
VLVLELELQHALHCLHEHMRALCAPHKPASAMEYRLLWAWNCMQHAVRRLHQADLQTLPPAVCCQALYTCSTQAV